MSGRLLMRTVRGKEIQPCYYPQRTTVATQEEPPISVKKETGGGFATLQRSPTKDNFSPGSLTDGGLFGGSCQIHGPSTLEIAAVHSETEELSISAEESNRSPVLRNPAFSHSVCSPGMHKSCFCVRFIAEHTKMLEESTKVKEDWKYVAMVLDRLFLWIFTLAVLVGTAGIILQAPTLYDDRIPIDKKFRELATSTVVRCPPQ
uniref:(California timema) hypothetical protein n=1 Tax=Timema californicum TaxID=61474 RepID=A0A7R9PC32_TIMCA|nr:unnamed protein product [Timema californicum]